MELQDDIREFIKLLLSEKVDFVLVGGYALAFHGAPRFTEDIDFLIQISPANAERLIRVLADFGFSSLDIRKEDFLEPDYVIQLGMPPNRIDILTSVDGVSWGDVWESKITCELDNLPIFVIGKEVLIRNKLATGRTKDKADAERLIG